MADQDRYDDDDYYRRHDRDDENFSGQIRGENSPRSREQRERSRRNPEAGDWYNQGAQRNQDWERTRQWRQDAGRGINRDFDYSEGYGRSYNRGSFDSDREINRDWDQEYRRAQGERNRDFYRDRDYNRGRDINRSSAARIYDTDWYDWNFERGFEEDDFNRGPDRFYGYGQRYNRGSRYEPQNRSVRYHRGRGQYGTAGMGADYEGNYGQHRSAGMRSDYGGYGYDSRDYGGEEPNYRRGDIGYEPEGAFYQDLDEPINYTYYEIWMIPGEFTGMGPRNYQRSDERIKEEVCERLTRHGRIDASGVEIDVQDGEVTLKGEVQNREMKRLAEDTADSVSGVRQVNNEIHVQRRDPDRSSSWSHRQDWEQRGRQRQEDLQESRQESPRIPATGAASGMTGTATAAGQHKSTAAGMANRTEDQRGQLRVDMEVIGSNGKVIGHIKEIRDRDFLVDRDMARDIYVPFDQVRSVGAQAMLAVTDEEVDNQGWEKPTIL